MKQDTFHSNVAIILSLGFWLPLFNIGMSLVSIYFAVLAITLNFKDKDKFGGRYRAITALIISSTTFIASIIFYIIYAIKKIETGGLF